MRNLTLACLVCAATGLPAKDLYVSPTGSDDNPGTRQQPFASLGKALPPGRAPNPERSGSRRVSTTFPRASL